MLDRAKLIKEVQHISDTLFVSYANEYTIAQQVWRRIADDVTFIHAIKAADVPWALPTWTGKLDAAIPVLPQTNAYRAISVDGSQIYPDRHQGVSCYLLNVGSVSIEYGAQGSTVHFNSVPHVFMTLEAAQEVPVSVEYINCRRQELEFASGIQLAAQTPEAVVLFDGSLIFWQLASKDTQLKDIFLPIYCEQLNQLYQTKTLNACYVSLAKNKELVNLIRTALCDFDATNDAHTAVEHVIDTAVANFFLTPGTRTIVFKSMHALCAEYPEHVWPHFFYLHVGSEIGRVEIPAWIAQDDALVDAVASAVYDQCIKGRGYPVVLAEAHEQAVVKGPDRDFFYQLIAKIGVEKKQRILQSQKSLKKRGIAI